MHLISIIFRFTIQLAVINTVLSVPSPHPSPTISPSPSLSKSDFDKTTVGKEQDASPPLEPPSQEGLESGRFNTPASRLSSLSSSGSQSADAVVASTFQPVWDASIYDLLPNSNGIGFNPSWTIDHVSVDFSKVIGQSSAGTKVFIGDSKTTPSIKVAVKVFNLEQVMQEKRTTSKEGTLQLLLKEGNILGIASHPNILKVSGLSLSLDGSRAFVFSEFCGRGDLVDLVQWSQRHLKNDRQEWKRRMHCVFWQLMHGLAHLHAENIHRKVLTSTF